MTSISRLVLAAVLTVAFATGCASPQKAYDAARMANTKESYNQFVSQFPDTQFASEARERIMEIDYKNAVADGSASALRHYLREYQAVSSLRQDVEARLLKMEDEAFLKAKSEDTPMRWEVFIRDWPSSKRLEDARAALRVSAERVDYATAKQEGTPEALQQYINRWPKGINRKEAETLLTEANARIEGKSFDEAMATRRYVTVWEHMVGHTDGATAPKAKQVLDAWKWIVAGEPVLISWDKLPYRINSHLDDKGFNDVLSRLAKRDANPFGLQMIECGYTRADFTCLLQEVLFVRTNLTAHAAFAQKAITPSGQDGVPPCIPITVHFVQSKVMEGVWTFTFSGDQDTARVFRIAGTQSACIIPEGSTIVIAPRPDDSDKKDRGPSVEAGIGFGAPTSFHSFLFQRLGRSTDTFINVFGVACKKGTVRVTDQGLELQPGTVFAEMK